MSRSLKLQMIFVCLISLFASSCSEVAITGRRQFNLVPDSMINSMSFQEYDSFISQAKLSNDTAATAMVKRVGGRIQGAVERYAAANGLESKIDGYQWEFNLVEDPAVNAWAMPGGKVVVFTGLLDVSGGEEGLAVVLGHEIAHAFAKHGSERMTQGLLIELGGMALSEAVAKQPEKTQQLFIQSYGMGTQLGVILPYSRQHEYEADHIGLIFMAMAGYDPNGAVSFWERMAAKEGSSPPELLSTHPSDANRIANIKRLIPEAMTYYKR